MVFAIFPIVHTLSNQLLLETSVYPFNTLQVHVTDILKVCMKKSNDINMRGLSSISSLCRNKFNKFNNTGEGILNSIFHNV